MQSAMLLNFAEGAMFAGRYRVERRIASGGMGAVYEVLHIETNRRRALKVMHAHYVHSDELRQRFRLEARVAADIDSDHIVDVFDAGLDEATGMLFLVMELLRGEDLGKRIKRIGAMPRNDVVRYLHEASLALDKTHQSRIVHRDLKPDNLFLSERDHGVSRIKVLDFGIAKILIDGPAEANATRSMGTPLYMAPEQFSPEGIVSPATDIFALGMIAFTLLVGKPYWLRESRAPGGAIALAVYAARGPVESAVQRARELAGIELPPEFDRWFFQATCADPARRFASAGEAVRALAEALRVSGVGDEKARASQASVDYSLLQARQSSANLELIASKPGLPGSNTVPTQSTFSATRPRVALHPVVPAVVGGVFTVMTGLVVFSLWAGRATGVSPTLQSLSAPAPASMPRTLASAQYMSTTPSALPLPLPATSSTNVFPDNSAVAPPKDKPSSVVSAPVTTKRTNSQKTSTSGVPWSR